MVELLSTESSRDEYKRVHCTIVFIVFYNSHLKKKGQQTPAMALSKHSTCTNSGVDISGMTFYTRQTNYLVQAPNFTNSPN